MPQRGQKVVGAVHTFVLLKLPEGVCDTHSVFRLHLHGRQISTLIITEIFSVGLGWSKFSIEYRLGLGKVSAKASTAAQDID